MDSITQIARVKAGSFEAWFDKVENKYEVQWYDNHSPRAFAFTDEQSAKEFWHSQVIDRKQFQHCYCC